MLTKFDDILQRPRFVIYAIAAFCFCVIVWSYVAKLDEVVIGQGTIKPRQEIQKVQSLEGGIVREVFVKTGDIVEEGQPLVRLDDIAFKAALNEQMQEMDNLKAGIAQLSAELDAIIRLEDKQGLTGFDLEKYFDRTLSEQSILSAKAGFRASMDSLRSETNTLIQRIEQAEKSLTEAINHKTHLQDNLKIANEELELNKPAFEKGAISGVEILKLKRAVNDTKAELDATSFNIERKRRQVDEAKLERETVIAKAKSKTQDELTQNKGELAQLEANSAAIADKVNRSIISSPVSGVVKSINAGTKGGVMKPGETMIEVVPLDSNLLVEVKITPQDIGFIRPGLPALVKLTAYDFVIYGGLKGQLNHISADTILDDEGNAHFVGHVLIDNTVTDSGHYLDLIPGMQASVDIIAGEKTVMQYWLKPILRAQASAMREM